MLNRIKRLNEVYISARYQNGMQEGTPVNFYSEEDSEECIALAEKTIRIVERLSVIGEVKRLVIVANFSGSLRTGRGGIYRPPQTVIDRKAIKPDEMRNQRRLRVASGVLYLIQTRGK
jgi:hypothetical protein